MAKKFHSLFLMLTFMGGMMCCTACSSSDDEETPVVQPAEPADDPSKQEEPNILTTRSAELNRDMSGLNFKELEPLYESVQLMTPLQMAPRRADDGEVFIKAFYSKLSVLLALLRGENVELPYGRRFTFKSFNDVLEATWDVSGTLVLGMTGNTFFIGDVTSGSGEMSLTTKDGIVYTIKAEIEKDTYIANWKINVTSARLLTVYKGNEQVLQITSGSERKSAVWLPFIAKESTYDGEIHYKDYVITLSAFRESTHERHVDLTYSTTESTTPLLVMSAEVTDDASIIKLLKHDITFKADYVVSALDGMMRFVGTVNNINYMVVDGVKIAKLMEEGTSSKDDCDKLVKDFNDNLSMKMFLSDLDLGILFMSTVYDAEQELYRPTVMVNSQLLGEGDYALTDILKSLGVNMDGIMVAMSHLDD